MSFACVTLIKTPVPLNLNLRSRVLPLAAQNLALTVLSLSLPSRPVRPCSVSRAFGKCHFRHTSSSTCVRGWF